MVLIAPIIPHSLLTCSELPIVLEDDMTQRTAAEILIALEDSWQDCHSKLTAVRQIVVHAEQKK